MNSQELRLGNNIIYKGKVVKVVALDLDLEDECEPLIKVFTYEKEKSPIGGTWDKYVEFNDTHFNPIPLTEEWLLKFGWLKNDKEFEYVENPNLFIKQSESFGYEAYNPYGQVLICKKLKYVHQLQNLYFALTGEELIFFE